MSTLTLSTTEVCRAAGCTYRQLNHWVSLGVFEDLDIRSPGSGRYNQFTVEQTYIARAVAVLASLGSSRSIVAPTVAAQLAERHDWFDGLILVDRDGIVRAPLDPTLTDRNGWLIDLMAAADHVDRRLAEMGVLTPVGA